MINKSSTAVIILNYFGSEATFACVNSVKRSLEANIYLVDNSADLKEKEKLQDKYREDKGVILLSPPENLGFAAGVNLGLREALSDGFSRFLVLNNDAVLLDGAGPVLTDAFARHPGSLIAPAIAWGGEVCRGRYYHKYLGLITERPWWQGKGFLFYLTGCALAFDRDLLEKVGYFDESFFMYGEDLEYCFRAARENVPIILAKEVIVEHAGSAATRKGSFFYEYNMARAHWRLSFCLSDGFWDVFRALLGKSLVLSARALFRAIKYRSISPLAAFGLAPFPLPVRPRKK
ncbi:glycosyltransferase [Dissulfurirhabdus thermomarina]|uniref:Glycosyltransferase n=1 Tax=Dissulfurirhabdus thermomarina TaxID=1765737 RepID=A0A6N9TLZ5_DISTH|nr:glycosyltransferase [Dissulfurirhabdus thermomarina]NDY42301.1 glycosyltransferase [Dissulfurirhabdus thermomarina]NMX24160.1 glycosyltransferase [Dissulfurirhabdus thermomarina]